jgi:hypothetical protein
MNARIHCTNHAGGTRSAASDDRGLSTVEYVVLLVLVVGAAIGLWMNIGQDVRDKLTVVHNSFASVTYSGAAPQSPGSTGSASPAGSPVAAIPVVAPTPQPIAAPASAALTETGSGKTKEDR